MAITWDTLDLGMILCEALELDPNLVRRIIVDVKYSAGELVCVYVEMYGSDKLLEIDWAEGLKGAQIKEVGKCES